MFALGSGGIVMDWVGSFLIWVGSLWIGLGHFRFGWDRYGLGHFWNCVSLVPASITFGLPYKDALKHFVGPTYMPYRSKVQHGSRMGMLR